MSTIRSTWWSVTAFAEGEMKSLDGPTFPANVARVYGGREKCPTSGTIHFQGAIQMKENCRLSFFKAWLPTAHMEPARSNIALRKYAMKSATAIEEKKVTENKIPHYSAEEVCIILARKACLSDRQIDFYKLVSGILRDRSSMAGQLMNPSLRNFWEKTCNTWIAIVLQQSCLHKDGSICGGCEKCEMGERNYLLKPMYKDGLPEEEANGNEA